MTESHRRKSKTGNESLRRYSAVRAARFWNRRLASTDPLAAVLTYDAPTVINELYDQWERLAVGGIVGRSLRGTKAVDLGAGTGRVSLLLANRGAAVVSIDAADRMLAHLMRTARSRRIHNRITPIVSSVTRLPLADRSAGLVTCCGLLEHLPLAARNAAIGEAFRILSPSGRMIVVVNNTESIFLQGRYSLKAQRPDGYYVGSVGLSWLESAARRAGWRTYVRSANPWYALAVASENFSKQSKSQPAADRAFLAQLVRMDASADVTAPFVRRMATHYVVEILRR